ncbi:hypothetical protein [Dysgonomonas sp. 25]|uniref:hypothetical protein n=1 Tax=Dysgonomonas sp. 25 TaxID=2302933 RepID=UPI0013D7161D|nr:hypothetical protein [Dysgonomonas sp. 25]NDV70108.1 hypothetical protein [Dysgonomonas sp. 25]
MKTFLLSIFTLLASITAFAQEKKFYEGGPLSHLSIGLRASTMGGGVELATPLNSYFKMRAGINYIGFSTGSFDISLDDHNNHLYDAIGYVPDYKMKPKLDFLNGSLLIDFHPMKSGIFHITVGAFIGKNQLKARGYLFNGDTGERASLLDPNGEWPKLEFDGNELNIDGGRLDANIQLGEIVKPYAGIGLGRSITKNRVGFKFELGVIYQGDYSIKQNGRKVDTTNLKTENFEDADQYTKWLRWWPMLNFQLTYRIF